MSNIAKQAILRAKVEGVLTDLMVRTTAENVLVDENTKLSAKLAELAADIALRAKSEDVTAEIAEEIGKLVNGAPETYDTLKEISDYIAEHQTVADALNEAIGAKADKSALEALQTAVGEVHTHENKEVLDGITAEKVAAWDNKGKVYYASAEPDGLEAGDLWFQIVE